MEPLESKVNNIECYYGSASYRFNDWFETGIYYSVYYKDRSDRDGTKTPYTPDFNAFQKEVCLSFRFDPSDHWSFKLEGHLIDGTALCFPQDNFNESGVPEYNRNWYLLAAKMTFNF